MVDTLLSVSFACGVFIAVAHVVNRPFIAPVYDVVANLAAFACAAAASVLLGHLLPAVFAGLAFVCWLGLARRTALDRRRRAAGRRAPRRSLATNRLQPEARDSSTT